jgi:magnesium transporter
MLEAYGIEKGVIAPREAKGAPILVFSSPDEAERQVLIQDYGVAPHDLASALDPDELGRVDSQGNQFVIILKRPRNFTGEDQLLFTVTSLGLFFNKRRLVIVASDGLGLFGDKLIHRTVDVRDAILKLLYGTIAHFLGHLKVINMLSESLEKRISASMENRYLLDMFTLEKSLVYFVNGIDSNQAVLEKLRAAGAKLGFTEGQLEVLDEILIENRQCSKQAEIYSNILTGLMDARFSVVNNNLSKLMKRLTIISIIFMPMNLLAGIGGMSEFSGWTQGTPWWVAYGLFTLGLVPLGFLTFWILEKTGIEQRARERKAGRGSRDRLVRLAARLRAGMKPSAERYEGPK